MWSTTNGASTSFSAAQGCTRACSDTLLVITLSMPLMVLP